MQNNPASSEEDLITSLRTQNISLQREIGAKEQEIKWLKEELADYKKHKSMADAYIQDYEKLHQEIGRLKINLHIKQSHKINLNESVAELTQRVSQLNELSDTLRVQIVSLTNNKNELTSQKALITKRCLDLTRENQELKNSVNKLKKAYADNRNKNVYFTSALYNWLSNYYSSWYSDTKQTKCSNTSNRNKKRHNKNDSSTYSIKALLIVAIASCTLTSFAIACYLHGGVLPLIRNSYSCSYSIGYDCCKTLYNLIAGCSANFSNFCSNAKTSTFQWSTNQINCIQSSLSSCSSYCFSKIYDARCAIADFIIYSINTVIEKAKGIIDICYG